MVRTTPLLLLALGCTPDQAPAPNRAPEVGIEAPEGGAVRHDQPVGFRGRVADDGPLTDLSVTLESSLDGPLDLPEPAADGTVASLLSGLSIGAHTLTLEAVDAEGKRARATARVEVVGPLAAPAVALVPAAPTTVDDLGASLVDEAPFAGLQIDWEWRREGSADRVVGSALASSETARDERWTAVVTVTDALGQVARGSASVDIANTAPTLASAALAPVAPLRTGDLTCSWSGWSDVDGDPEGTSVAWIRQVGAGVQTLSGDQPTRSAADLWPGDEVGCVVTPVDGSLAGPAVASPTVVVGNQPPSLTGARVDAASPTRLDAVLTCVPEGVSDPEGDPVRHDIQWLRDGVVVPGLTDPQVAGGLVAGESWACEVTPRDDWDAGAPVLSSAVLIENTPPTLASATLTGGNTCEPWSCLAWGPGDADGDPVGVTWRWWIDGVEQAETSDTLAAGLVGNGSAVTCGATPQDGTDAGAEVLSDPLVASDAPPQVSSVTLPDHGRPGDLLVCGATATDDCTDPVALAYAWTRNGVVVPGANSSTLPTLGYAGGDEIQCLVTVDDGGNPATSYPSNPLRLAANGWDIAGTEADGLAGWSVTVADDLDGDGYREIVVGAPNTASEYLPQAGRVYVANGRDDVEQLTLDTVADGTDGFSIDGQGGGYDLSAMACGPWYTVGGCPTLTEVGELSGYATGPEGAGLGFAVAYAGDIDNDGVGDLIATAPYHLAGDGIYAGRTFVMGGDGLDRHALWRAEAGESGYVFDGECGRRKDLDDDVGLVAAVTGANGDLAGFTAVGLGDFNGDGLGDFAVGAPNHGWADEGTVYVVYGRTDGLPVDGRDLLSRGCEEDTDAQPGAGDGIDGTAVYGADMVAPDLFRHYGETLGPVGDFDGDGYDDLYVQSPPLAFMNGGQILLGGPDRTAHQVTTLTSEAAIYVDYGDFSLVNGDPPIYSGQFGMGMPVGGGGDLNGDGRDDLVFQTKDYDTGAFLQVVYGRPGGARLDLEVERLGQSGLGFQVLGDLSISNNGEGAVRIVGDVNGDGYDDVAVGLPIADAADRGYGAVVFGGPVPVDRTWAELLAGTGGFVVEGPVDGANLGWSVASGDIDGDGLDDVLFGVPGADGSGGESRAGGVRVEYGRNFTAAIDLYGGPSDEDLVGSGSDDRIVGGRGHDLIAGLGGADVLYGGAGDDWIAIADDGFLRVRGGAGEDTLVLEPGVPTLDLLAVGRRLSGIERILLEGQVLSLSTGEVNRLSDTSNRLVVEGVVGTLEARPGDPWVDAGIGQLGGADFYVLTANHTELWVQVDLDTRIPPTIHETDLVFDENPLAGELIVDGYATDPDGSDGALTYVLVDDPTGALALDGATGALTVVDPVVFDFESGIAPFEVRVAVTDEDGLQTERALRFSLADVNEAPVALGGPPLWSVEEGAPLYVGTVSAVDLDADDAITWLITDDPAGIFEIDPYTGDVSLIPGSILDYETVNAYTLVATAVDLGGLSVDIPAELLVLDAEVIEQDVRLNFRMRERSLFADEPTWTTPPLIELIFDSDTFSYLCIDPIGNEGTWIDNWSDTLADPTAPHHAWTPSIPFQLEVHNQGRICAGLDIEFDAGQWNADLPVDVHLEVPDNVVPGTVVPIVSSFDVSWDDAAFWGNAPGFLFRGEITAEDFGMEIFACESLTGAGCGQYVVSPFNTTLQDEYHQPETPFVGILDVANDRMKTDGLVLSEANGFEFDTSPTLATAAAAGGIPSHVGSFDYVVENAGPNGEDATLTLDYTLFQALFVVNTTQTYDLKLQVDGVDATLILENGVTVPFTVGTDFDLDVPADADVDGDGLVSVEVDFSLDLQFRNEWYRYWETGSNVVAGLFEFTLRNEADQVVSERSFGPVWPEQCGFIDSHVANQVDSRLSAPCFEGGFTTPYNFDANAPGDLTVLGAIQLQ